MFDWTTHSGYLYLPAWVREIGAMMQLLPLLLVPFVAVIQSCRYFLNGHGPLHEVRRLEIYYFQFYGGKTYHYLPIHYEMKKENRHSSSHSNNIKGKNL